MRYSMELLRTAARRLSRQSGFSLMVIGVLALGLTIAISMFSVLRAVVLESLPYAHADRVVVLSSTNTKKTATGLLTPAELHALQGDDRHFEAVANYEWGGATVLAAGERPREFTVGLVSANFFRVLSPSPVLGRAITAADVAQEAPVIVLSHARWMREFDGDRAVIGRTLALAEGNAEVIGVMPPEFQFPDSDVGGWIPLRPGKLPTPDSPLYANARFVSSIALLKAGVSAEAAEVASIARFAQVRLAHSQSDEGWRPVLVTAFDDLLGETQQTMWACFALSLLVLVIACANAGLALQARLLARSREHAVLLALGARRGYLFQVMIMELLLLSLAAAALALLMTQLLTGALGLMLADALPRGDGIAINWAVVLVSVALAVLSVLIASLLGARLREQPNDALRGGRNALSLRSSWLKFGPTIGIALSTVALVAACSLALSTWSLHAVVPGFRAQDVQVLQLFRKGGRDEWRRFAPAVRAALTGEPGLEAAAYTTAAPLSAIGRFEIDAQVAGRASVEPYQALMRGVSPGYRGLLDVPLKSGRDFLDSDRADVEKVAIINEALARVSFGSTSPLGEQLMLPLGSGARVAYTVVGVMADHRNRGPRAPVQPEIWLPFDQAPWVGVSFLARSTLPARDVQGMLERAVAAVAPEEAATRQFSLADDLHAETQLTELLAKILVAFGVCALLLAGLGVYVLTTLVERARISEFGLRIAVGARPSSLARRLIREALSLTGLGFLVGAGAAVLVLQLLRSQLFGIGAAPLSSYLLTGITLMVAVALSTALPALRVARLDAMRALHARLE